MDNPVITLRSRFYRNYPPHRPLGYTEEEVALKVNETVFLIVDVYHKGYDDDHDPGGVDAVYKREVEANREIVVNHIKPAKAAARRLGLPVVYLTNYLSPGLTQQHEWHKLNMRTMNISVFEAWPEPSDVLAFSKIIAPEPGDHLIKKQFYSGFFETHLDSLLHSLGARNLVTVGFDSRICLGTTVVDAMYRSYRVIVLRDCTGTYEFAETEEGRWANFMAIRFIETCVGNTATAEDWIRACEAARA